MSLSSSKEDRVREEDSFVPLFL